jgi:hypothetical protein
MGSIKGLYLLQKRDERILLRSGKLLDEEANQISFHSLLYFGSLVQMVL